MYDVEYDLEGGEGSRSKITFISWTPDDAALHVSFYFFLPPHEERACSKNCMLSFAREMKTNEADPTNQPRMMYSSSKEAIKRALNGLAADIQASDADDIEWENIKSRVSKGR